MGANVKGLFARFVIQSLGWRIYFNLRHVPYQNEMPRRGIVGVSQTPPTLDETEEKQERCQD